MIETDDERRSRLYRDIREAVVKQRRAGDSLKKAQRVLRALREKCERAEAKVTRLQATANEASQRLEIARIALRERYPTLLTLRKHLEQESAEAAFWVKAVVEAEKAGRRSFVVWAGQCLEDKRRKVVELDDKIQALMVKRGLTRGQER